VEIIDEMSGLKTENAMNGDSGENDFLHKIIN